MNQNFSAVGQVEIINGLLNEREIPRTTRRFMDNLGNPLVETAPWDANICTLSVSVNWNKPWHQAINIGTGPKIPNLKEKRGAKAWKKAGNFYLPKKTGEEVCQVILINYPCRCKFQGFAKANIWASRVGLVSTSPYHAFAIAEQYPKLHKQIVGGYFFYLVSTTNHSLNRMLVTCSAEWHEKDDPPFSTISWVGDFRSDRAWFAYEIRMGLPMN